MKILLCIPHVFAPKTGSLYSSQTEAKRDTKQKALFEATLGNLSRLSQRHFIHASLGKGQPVVTRPLNTTTGADINIQIFTQKNQNLAGSLPPDPRIQIKQHSLDDPREIPLLASRALLEQSSDYDLVGYMEDDLLIEDTTFFDKIRFLNAQHGDPYVFLPHRCEAIPNLGDVILSGDPDGGRKDLFWDTGEALKITWPLGDKTFYRATNPHSGCYFLTRSQAQLALNHWVQQNWTPQFMLSGPLEQAGSGLLLPIFKLMKPIPNDYRFLMIRHQDELWTRHPFEPTPGPANP